MVFETLMLSLHSNKHYFWHGIAPNSLYGALHEVYGEVTQRLMSFYIVYLMECKSSLTAVLTAQYCNIKLLILINQKQFSMNFQYISLHCARLWSMVKLHNLCSIELHCSNTFLYALGPSSCVSFVLLHDHICDKKKCKEKYTVCSGFVVHISMTCHPSR